MPARHYCQNINLKNNGERKRTIVLMLIQLDKHVLCPPQSRPLMHEMIFYHNKLKKRQVTRTWIFSIMDCKANNDINWKVRF